MDRPVVREHPNIGVAYSLDDRSDVKLRCIAVGEFDDARSDRTWKSARVSGEIALARDRFMRLLVHEVTLLGLASASGFESDMDGARSFAFAAMRSEMNSKRIVLHPTEKRRSPSVLPGQPQEEQTGDRR